MAPNLLCSVAMRQQGPSSTEPDELAGRCWIVVADADENAASTLAGHLLHQRFRAYPTRHGVEALRVAEAHPLALAVIDVQLADMAGRELVARLRAIDPGLPVIMTTADFRPAVEMDARQLGIAQYVQKPFDPRRLERVAARIVATRLNLAEAGCRRSDP